MDAFLDGKRVTVDPTNIIFQIPGKKGWFQINESSSHDYPEIEPWRSKTEETPAYVQKAKQASQRRRSKRNTTKKSKTSKKSGKKSR